MSIAAGETRRSESSYDLDGDLIVVDASLPGPTGRGTVRLVLDTGSTRMTLTPAIAEALGYTSTDHASRSVVRSAVAEATSDESASFAVASDA